MPSYTGKVEKTTTSRGGKRIGAGRKAKGEKIEFKVTPEQKASILQSAKLSNMTMTDYILSKLF